MTLPEQRIVEIKERVANTTDGPWDVVTPDGTLIRSATTDIATTIGEYQIDYKRMEADAEFIRHARQDIPDMIAEREEHLAEIERLRAALDRSDTNLRLAIDRKPIRDLAETYAETRAALGGNHE